MPRAIVWERIGNPGEPELFTEKTLEEMLDRMIDGFKTVISSPSRHMRMSTRKTYHCMVH